MSSKADDRTNWAKLIETRNPTEQHVASNPVATKGDVPSVEEYWRVARSAFQYDHSKEAVRAHTIDADVLVDASIDDELVGFCSCDIVSEFEQPAVYLNGAAVAEAFQNQGIGRALMIKSVEVALAAGDLEDPIIFATTQNPAVVSLLEEAFDSYPKPDLAVPLPTDIERCMEPFAAWLNPGKQFDPPVIRYRYEGEMIYESIPDHPYRTYTDTHLQYENGDAMLCVAGIPVPP